MSDDFNYSAALAGLRTAVGECHASRQRRFREWC